MIYVRNALFFMAASLAVLIVLVLLWSGDILRAQNVAHATHVHARVLLGMPGIDANTEGELIISPLSVHFTTAQGNIDIARRRILTVSSGDERIETGGTTGRIARMLIPYGGGLVLGAVTHKKISLLTIEYLDSSGQYRGAVFLVSLEDLAGSLQPLQAAVTEWLPFTEHSHPFCAAQDVQPNTVQIHAVASDASSAFPPEDRVLLYENLFRKMKSEKSIAAVYRAGDHGADASCAEFSVTLRAITFNKGDQAVRASLGPLGHFVGTTRLTYHLTVVTNDGRPVVDRDLKASEGSDTDSLNITKVVSNAVLKNLKKSRQRARLNDAA